MNGEVWKEAQESESQRGCQDGLFGEMSEYIFIY